MWFGCILVVFRLFYNWIIVNTNVIHRIQKKIILSLLFNRMKRIIYYLLQFIDCIFFINLTEIHPRCIRCVDKTLNIYQKATKIVRMPKKLRKVVKRRNFAASLLPKLDGFRSIRVSWGFCNFHCIQSAYFNLCAFFTA